MIVALGVRNPWRFSFDRANGDLWIGDVGQGAIEEVDHVAWPLERAAELRLGRLRGPVVVRARSRSGPGGSSSRWRSTAISDGCSITGGYVYRGSAVPAAAGRYFYGDYCSGHDLVAQARQGGVARQIRPEPFTVVEPDLVRRGQRRRALRRLRRGHGLPARPVIPVCATCGAWFPDGPAPGECPICEDERQWVPEDGQRWTTADELAAEVTRADVREVEPGLTGIGLEPAFGIGQRMLLVENPAGNVLWDMIPGRHRRGRCGRATQRGPVQRDRDLSPALLLGDVGLERSARRRTDPPACRRSSARDAAVPGRSSTGTVTSSSLPGAITLLRLGGHFAGGTVLHWPAGAEGRGALLTGDIVMVVPDRTVVSFMWSYPNLLPLPASEVAAHRRGARARRPSTGSTVPGGTA